MDVMFIIEQHSTENICVLAVVKILLVALAKWPQDAGHSWTVNISAKTEEVTLAVGVFSWQAWQCWQLRPALLLSSVLTSGHSLVSAAHQAAHCQPAIRGHNQQY